MGTVTQYINDLLIKKWGAGLEKHPTIWDQGNLGQVLATMSSDTGAVANTDMGDISDSLKNSIKEWIHVHPWTETFNSRLSQFKTDFKIWSEQTPYDKEAWSDAELERVFREQHALRPDDPGSATSNVTQIIENDFIEKKDAGAIAEDGTRTDNYDNLVKDGNLLEGQALKDAQGDMTSKTNTALDTAFSKYGLDKNTSSALYKHVEEMLSNGEIDEYEMEQFLQTDSEYLKAQYKESYDKYSATIDEAEKRELNILAGEDERTAKLLDVEYAKMVPELAALAKQYGGRTREDTYISDTLSKSRTDLETARQNNLEMQRVQVKAGQESRRQTLESGDFSNVNAQTASIANTNLENYRSMLEQQLKTQQTMQQISLAKSNMLATRAQDRFQRDYDKELKRQADVQKAASNAASKKARKLGAWVNPVISGIAAAAAPFTGGASLGVSAMAGMIGAGGMYGMQQTGQSAPNLLAMTTYGKDAGTGVSSTWSALKDRYGKE